MDCVSATRAVETGTHLAATTASLCMTHALIERVTAERA